MSRLELIEEIRRLFTMGIPKNSLVEDSFLDIPDYHYLRDEYNDVSNRVHKRERWHQIVRFALDDPAQRQYIYQQLLRLVLKYRKRYNTHFRLLTEKGPVLLPDAIADLDRFIALYREYFFIYRNIVKRVHFDYPNEKLFEARVRGRINWQKTLIRNATIFPVKYETFHRIREFDVPENTLLILAAYWLNKESSRLLNLEFKEGLSQEESRVLNLVSVGSRDMLRHFPFQDVLPSAKLFSTFPMDDKRILELEQKAATRIERGQTSSNYYATLLEWIQKFKELGITMVSREESRFRLESVNDLDTVYEGWIFYEIMDFFVEKLGLELNPHLDENPSYFEFEYEGEAVRLYYNRTFQKGKGHGWALTHTPDYTAVRVRDDRIIAILDAKNYSKDSWEKPEATNKMLAYLINLDCGFGALCFPDFDHEEFTHVEGLTHHDIKLVHYRMPPNDSSSSLKLKEEMVGKMVNEILKRVNSQSNSDKPCTPEM